MFKQRNKTWFGRGTSSAVKQYAARWGAEGMNSPDEKQVKDMLCGASLMRNEDYLIDPRVGSVSMRLHGARRADIDGSAVLLDAQFRVVDVVSYENLKSRCGSVIHSGDNTTGEGTEDDVEVISVNLESIPLCMHHILFTVCVYSYGVSSSQEKGSRVSMMRGKQGFNPQAMCELELHEGVESGYPILLGQMTRKGGYWSGEKPNLRMSDYSVRVTLQNRPCLIRLNQSESFAPCLREISVCVVKGTNLAPKDVVRLFRRKASSDPYYLMSYNNNVRQSKYKNRTLNPEWNEAFFSLGDVMESDPKPLRIEVFDYDSISKDDFMGTVEIPARDLYTIGIGKHQLTCPLMHSKQEQFRHEDVSGEIHLQVSVTSIDSGDSHGMSGARESLAGLSDHLSQYRV